MRCIFKYLVKVKRSYSISIEMQIQSSKGKRHIMTPLCKDKKFLVVQVDLSIGISCRKENSVE